jgi:hypothetical protein
MKKTIHIFLWLLLPNAVLLAQLKTDSSYKKPAPKAPQYEPFFFGFDVATQINQPQVTGSANITAAQQQRVNIGIYGGYKLRKHKFDIGFTLSNTNNNWRYTNTPVNATINQSLDRSILNTRFGYSFRFFRIGNRFTVEAGVGIDWLRLISSDTLFVYPVSETTKLISAQQERLLNRDILGFDGKLQVNYALNPHVQLRLFAQYRYATDIFRTASVTYYDAITGLEHDRATIKTARNDLILGIGMQYNLKALFSVDE